MSRGVIQVYNALIRTHHITSRKKVQKIKKAAADLGVGFVVIRSGGPGIMYAESAEDAAVRQWVATVQSLRYKDYRCVHKPAAAHLALVSEPGLGSSSSPIGFTEVGSVAEFAELMEKRGLGSWWRDGMGY